MRVKTVVHSLFLAALLSQWLPAQALSVPWRGYGHDPQHTGISSFAAQPLNRIKWSTPVDLVNQGSSGELLIHYGSPLVTEANTVIVPVRTNSSDVFRVRLGLSAPVPELQSTRRRH